MYHSHVYCSHTSVFSNVCTFDKKLCELPSPFTCIFIFANLSCELLCPRWEDWKCNLKPFTNMLDSLNMCATHKTCCEQTSGKTNWCKKLERMNCMTEERDNYPKSPEAACASNYVWALWQGLLGAVMGSLLLNEHVTSFFIFFLSRGKETALDGHWVSCRHYACCMCFFCTAWLCWETVANIINVNRIVSAPLLLEGKHSIH